MLTIDHTEVMGLEPAIRGMRNPKNSWSKSDSLWEFNDQQDEWQYHVGNNDHDLMMRLAAGGPVHAKYRRMITVYADIVGPAYWVAELDTYKVGTVRNSCSLQHKGASRDYTIRDFAVPDERIYDILDPVVIKKEHPIVYPYETEEYRLYTAGNFSYRIYRNGRVVCEAAEIHEQSGRVKHLKEHEVKPSQNSAGYLYLNLGGRNSNERWLLHRLVAHVWFDRVDGADEINHKDMNKGNNSVENLEWVTHKENEIHKHLNNGSGRTLRTDYLRYRRMSKLSMSQRIEIASLYRHGVPSTELARQFGISQPQAHAIATKKCYTSENTDLFMIAEYYDELIEEINRIRRAYVETGDYEYFLEMRQLLPMGYLYRFTWMANYEVLANIYRSRKDHMLPEWHTFCDWIKSLPYSEIITGEINAEIHT